jgi:Domain of unknown function (DUF1707)/Domain of unknown function (DUF4190)
VPGSPLRVTDRDRDATIGALQTSYTTGRLTKDEHDGRVGVALTATTYGQLDQLTADLPDRPAYPDAPAIAAPRRTNKVAVAALVCGLAQPVTGMITTIPAIALGHVARGQIRRSGDDGKAMATWGALLGWAGLTAAVAAVAILVWILVLFTHAAPGH